MSQHPDEVTVEQLRDALKDADSGIEVIDVREQDEYDIASIDGARLIPLKDLPERAGELDPAQSYYIHCKKGGRSMKALEFLRSQGFAHLKSVQGGIDAWRENIDPSMPGY